MPQVTVYIRNEDLEQWKALENKSQAISDMLNGGSRGRGGGEAKTSAASPTTNDFENPQSAATGPPERAGTPKNSTVPPAAKTAPTKSTSLHYKPTSDWGA